jgi:nitrite reductase/ring-hydroxylating ferredoxin subunit
LTWIGMSPRTQLPPYPNSWFLFGFSDELPPGGLLARPFMGQQVAVFRTPAGQAAAVDAYCPHLGAHFGYGRRVEGELLRCPFHGFCYDTQGRCVRTGYGTPPPPKAVLRTWPLREQNGLLLVYHHAQGAPPAWEIPALEANGWTTVRYRKFELFDHPQETTENSVDVGHFAFVHNYRNTRMLRQAVTEGPYLSTAFAVQRAVPGLERLLPELLFEFQFDTQIYGLGYSLVNVSVPALKLQARLWVLPTAIDEQRITLHLAASLRADKGPLLSRLLAGEMLRGLVRDARQDFVIWQNKQYLHPPALAEGDGPIGKYASGPGSSINIEMLR